MGFHDLELHGVELEHRLNMYPIQLSCRQLYHIHPVQSMPQNNE